MNYNESTITHADLTRLHEAAQEGYLIANANSSPSLFVLYREHCTTHNRPYVAATLQADTRYLVVVNPTSMKPEKSQRERDQIIDLMAVYGDVIAPKDNEHSAGYGVFVAAEQSRQLIPELLALLYQESDNEGINRLLSWTVLQA